MAPLVQPRPHVFSRSQMPRMKSQKPKYRRILLKLSGEALGDAQSSGIDAARVSDMAEQIGEVRQLGIEVVIVIGGGNIFRGVAGRDRKSTRLNSSH